MEVDRKKEIENREDVYFLVDTFYKIIRKDETLGAIFNNTISDWPKHIDHLTDFWESNLFFKDKYRGNPARKHQVVDSKHNNSISAFHFGIWLNHWFAVLEKYFTGEKALLAKNRARNMGTHIMLKIFEARQKA